jgi:hypothetical protein
MGDLKNEAVIEATRKVNSLKFAIELWDKVELVEDENGEEHFINAQYIDDPYRPIIKVSGYNELNGCDEEDEVPCWYMDPDASLSDYIAAGESPACSYPDEVEHVVFTHRINLKADLREAEEKLKAAQYEEEHRKDSATYYLLGEVLVGKRVNEPQTADYLFVGDSWCSDDEGVIDKLLNGEDLTKQAFESFDQNLAKAMNSITEIDSESAMEIIVEDTYGYLKMIWKDKYAKDKEEWDKDPKWWAKYVSIDFELYGVKKTLYPKDLPFKSGPSLEGFMELISSKLCDDLRERGAFIVATHGMMD